MEPELTRLRAAMDAVNQRLVEALHDRARLCRRIAALKQAHGATAYDPDREAAMRTALLGSAPADGLPAAALAPLLDAVFAASRQLVEQLCERSAGPDRG